MKVILFAPVYSRSGYGDHSREVVSYLLENKKIELEIILELGKEPRYLLHTEKRFNRKYK